MYASHLECPKWNATYESEERIQLCRCGSPLLVRYHLKKVKRTFHKKVLVSVAAGDDEILRAQQMLARDEGIFCCPEGAATLSAAIQLVKSKWIKPDEKVVLLNTGTGLKYPETVVTEPPLLQPGDRLPGVY